MKIKEKTTRKGLKKGISLIVLVITIIVMIILAAAVILSLSSNGIIDRANEAVTETDLKQVQTLATTIWSEVYLENMENAENEKLDYETEVILRLQAQKIDTSKYDIDATDKGVVVKLKEGIQHGGVIPAGGTYYVGVTSATLGDYTGATAVYKGPEFAQEDANGINSPLAFGLPYSADMSGTTISLVAHTDGSADIYEDETLTQSVPAGTLTYNGTDILIDGEVFAVVNADGGQIDATAALGGIFTLDSSAAGTGDSFPETISDGDVFVFRDYEYRYNSTWVYLSADFNGWVTNDQFEDITLPSGWSVRVLNDTKTTYSAVSATINGADVTNMCGTFIGCTALTIAPAIPNSVTNMRSTFWDCESLTATPAIPAGVTDMYGTFAYCTSLTAAPAIPASVLSLNATFLGCTSLITAPNLSNCTVLTNMDSTFRNCTVLRTYTGASEATADGDFSEFVIPSGVTNMRSTFEGCELLTAAPVIPASVTDMYYTFNYCTSLTGSIIIHATPTTYDGWAYRTGINEILGNCTIKDEML